ncbi:hypothetical protein A4S02_09050 [Acetobacter ascendens]|uniref:TIR domain-containing protein n=2 Tax=Acetobacter TaxID=434 RepID=A0A1D8QX25_9PROT|nr:MULTISPECIES: toll/interleukin-1 receptor domain-containing protein [Acetobacter]AOW46889.1 hypothetical protein A4S02_09050 [Acetobacter ascendens]KXV70701.1 hypothetical protein AD951_02330 [Acetobacter malorum]
MSVSTERAKVARLQQDIANLRIKDAQEAKKEADFSEKVVKATNAAQVSRSASTITTKLNEARRASGNISSVQKKRADIAKSIATKSAELHRAQTALEKAEDIERKRFAVAQKKADDDRNRLMRQLEQQLRDQRRAVITAPIAVAAQDPDAAVLPDYDVFISHASEDKDSFVRPFAERLTALGIKPFYDEMSLTWGDSLRRRIDLGLARSRFGIVVLSRNFFAKEWPQRELDGLVALEVQGQSRILPIWHEISKDEVARFSPMLADKLALNTSVMSVDEIVQKLLPLCRKNSIT